MPEKSNSVLHLAPFYFPHLGGVEKHVEKLTQELASLGFRQIVLTQLHSPQLKEYEQAEKVEIFRFSFPKIKFLGLLVIWWRLLSRYRVLFAQAKIIHVHDVMIWALPLRILFPRKKFVLTMHGWEGVYPVPWKNIWLKKISAMLSNKIICVGEYVGMYYGVQCDQVVYGGVDLLSACDKKRAGIVFLGRLEKDTGLPLLISAARQVSSDLKYSFIGDGSLKTNCKKIGQVSGWLPEKQVFAQLAKAEVCVAGGYLSALEAWAAGCEVIVIATNPLKRDYWLQSLFVNWVHWACDSSELLEIYKLIALGKLPSRKPTKTQLKQVSWTNMAQKIVSVYEI